ncbi:L,D-transpeptidase [Streptomyces sp. RLB1-33]|uniref:L,D-transpeptidase n=1 Tax=Streptomyces mirabilis TaxID=68239 RepID=UPI00143EAA9D|nr:MULTISPECIES: L,D-transpeptidase [Streptomyces]QIY72305.1 L,D-transpeptidase [Streptomyces sp. RLB1-33]QUW80747.1 L,D-transpeptidase [Streptomyces mirabilis]
MTRRARSRRIAAGWTAAALCALALAGCSKGAVTESAGTEVDTAAKPGTAAGQKPTTQPVKAKPLAKLTGAHINIADGQTVGIGMPISVTFDHAIPTGERAEVERQLKVDADVEGSWSWVKDRNLLEGQRVDFRPRAYWSPGTEVTVRAGSGITRHFTVGRSLVATVDVRTHMMRVVKDGQTRNVPITAGAAGMDTWNGTMVVSDKATKVFMNSQTVGYGDAYADYYYYAVHLTTSGTYLHQNPKANTYAGHQNVTHGCVGLATDGTAKKFYDEVIPGDVVTVVGSKDTVAVGNGYGDWNADWAQWQAGSALK